MQTTAYFDTKENGVRLIITGESQAESALLMLLNTMGQKRNLSRARIRFRGTYALS